MMSYLLLESGGRLRLESLTGDLLLEGSGVVTARFPALCLHDDAA